MRVYSKDSVKVIVSEDKKQDIRDVATALKEELIKQNVKLSVDTGALLYDLVSSLINPLFQK